MRDATSGSPRPTSRPPWSAGGWVPRAMQVETLAEPSAPGAKPRRTDRGKRDATLTFQRGEAPSSADSATGDRHENATPNLTRRIRSVARVRRHGAGAHAWPRLDARHGRPDGPSGDAEDDAGHDAGRRRRGIHEGVQERAHGHDEEHARAVHRRCRCRFPHAQIPHHQGAIEMAKAALDHVKDPETKKMAQKIIDDQEKEITEMRDWLKKH